MPKSAADLHDPLRAFPGYLIRRASMSLLGELNDRLSEFELRHTSFSLLQLIAANPGIKQTDAGRALEIKRANMVPLVAALEERGCITRKPIDGRSQGIELTAIGKRLARKALRVVRNHEKELIERVPEELQPAVVPVLTYLWKGARATESPGESGPSTAVTSG